MNYIDPDKIIKHKLYRQHTIKVGQVHIKDISKLGRNI